MDGAYMWPLRATQADRVLYRGTRGRPCATSWNLSSPGQAFKKTIYVDIIRVCLLLLYMFMTFKETCSSFSICGVYRRLPHESVSRVLRPTQSCALRHAGFRTGFLCGTACAKWDNTRQTLYIIVVLFSCIIRLCSIYINKNTTTTTTTSLVLLYFLVFCIVRMIV